MISKFSVKTIYPAPNKVKCSVPPTVTQNYSPIQNHKVCKEEKMRGKGGNQSKGTDPR